MNKKQAEKQEQQRNQNKFNSVTLPEASASAYSAISAYLISTLIIIPH